MKKFLKKYHISIISILSLIISLASLTLLIKNELSNNVHTNYIKQLNKDRLSDSLSYYDKFSKETNNYKLNKKLSDIEFQETLHNLIFRCHFFYTNDIKDIKLVPSPLCRNIVTNISLRIQSFDTELKRKEILQELDKLKIDIKNFINN